MKKIVSILLFGAFVLCSLSACAGQSSAPKSDAPTNPTKSESATESTPSTESAAPTDTPTAYSESTELSSEAATEPIEPASAERTLKMTVDGQEISIILYDTPTAAALYDALPMELNFSDYNGTERIAYPPDALPTAGEPDGCDPDVGDLCLYAPWGNLCIFYQDFRYSQSLIKLGRLKSGMDVLSGMAGDFTATLERTD